MTSGVMMRRPVGRRWEVDGVARTGRIYPPLPTTDAEGSSPVVFVFHGHTGTVAKAARSFAVQKLWPEAIVVYLQGLPTDGKFDREGKRPGWQHFAGDKADRDVKLFDVVWADLQKHYRVDKRRVFAVGHSNGGQMVYVLWEMRGEIFAGFASFGGGADEQVVEIADAQAILKRRPKLFMQIAGRKDPGLKFVWQERAGGVSAEAQWVRRCPARGGR